MIDWYKYYKNKYLKSKKAMFWILCDARRNPFCSEVVIRQLCNWLDRRTETMINSRVPKSGVFNLKLRKIPPNNSYHQFIKQVGGPR